MNTSVLVSEVERRQGACPSECSATGHVVSATVVGKLWSCSDGVFNDGVVSDGVVSDGVVSDGVVSNGMVSDG